MVRGKRVAARRRNNPLQPSGPGAAVLLCFRAAPRSASGVRRSASGMRSAALSTSPASAVNSSAETVEPQTARGSFAWSFARRSTEGGGTVPTGTPSSALRQAATRLRVASSHGPQAGGPPGPPAGAGLALKAATARCSGPS